MSHFLKDGITILEEKDDPYWNPTEEELQSYAEWLGMDPKADADLLYIAREGLTAPLPDGWKPCKDNQGELFYFNFKTGQSSWDHPSDETYRQLVRDKKRTRSAKIGGGTGHRLLAGVAALGAPEASYNRNSGNSKSGGELVTLITARKMTAKDGIDDLLLSVVSCSCVGAAGGSIAGSCCGSAVGLPLAPLTFGLSIPVCTVFGGMAGLSGGSVAGVMVGVAAKPWVMLAVNQALQPSRTMAALTDALQSSQDNAALQPVAPFVQAALQPVAPFVQAAVHSFASNPKVRAGTAAGGVCAVVLGAQGAAWGTVSGGLLGAAVGVVPAVFTFGLSIPVCGAVGSVVGGCTAASCGTWLGLAVGGAAGYLGTSASADNDLPDVAPALTECAGVVAADNSCGGGPASAA